MAVLGVLRGLGLCVCICVCVYVYVYVYVCVCIWLLNGDDGYGCRRLEEEETRMGAMCRQECGVVFVEGDLLTIKFIHRTLNGVSMNDCR